MPDPVPLAQLGGITYGNAKGLLARVVDNGVCDTDPRVVERADEATKLLLDSIIPVGAMATYDIVADGTELLLPPQLDNAIEVEVLGSGTRIHGQSDVKQGWYDIVNNFTYVDPSVQHDFPLQDLFLHPDPADASVLRRKYDFPGVTNGATVRVTGKKRWVPITSDSDYMIIQNLRALKMGVMALERWDINDVENGDKYYAAAIGLLEREVKNHLLDPRNAMKRRAMWEKDLYSYQRDTFGAYRAQLALDVPELMAKGKSEVSRLLDSAERRLISKGLWKGCLEVFHATVVNGLIQLPVTVESVLMARMDGCPIDVRSVFFGYQKNGPAYVADLACACTRMLADEGEVYDAAARTTRRQYSLTGACTGIVSGSTVPGSCLSMLCKLRWVPKQPGDRMVIRNYEALRLMVEAILNKDDPNGENKAIRELDKELNEYLGGQEMIVHIDLIPVLQGEVL